MRRPKKLLNITLTGLLVAATALPVAAAAGPPAKSVDRVCDLYSKRDMRGSIEADLVSTPLAPGATGNVDFRFKNERSVIKLRATGLPDPAKIGPEYLTYLAWSVQAGGDLEPLGEIDPRAGAGKLETTLPSDALGIVITAEPHFGVAIPSDSVVLRAVPVGKAAKKLLTDETTCSFLPRGHYVLGRAPEELAILLAGDRRTPRVVLQARNAVTIAQLRGAGKYASERYRESAAMLVRAHEWLGQGQRDQAVGTARKAVELAASADRIAEQRRLEDQQARLELSEARERLAAVERELEVAKRSVQEEVTRREETEAQLRLRDADAQVRREESTVERIERAIGQLTRTPAETPAAVVPAPAQLAPLPGVPQPTERERALEEQLLQARLEVERTRLNAEMERQRTELERERARLESARTLIETEQTKLAADQGKLAQELERIETERKRVEAERAAPIEGATATSARGAEGTVQNLVPLRPAVTAAPEPTVAPVTVEPPADVLLLQRERDLEARQAELDAREQQLEQTRVALEERVAEIEAASAAVGEATVSEAAPDSETKRKRSWWPFGRKKRQAETEQVTTTGDNSSAADTRDAEMVALTYERAELDRRWAELERAREEMARERQIIALDRQRPSPVPTTVFHGASSPPAPAAAPAPFAVVQAPPASPATDQGTGPTADQLRLAEQQRRIIEQQEQLIGLTQSLSQAGEGTERQAPEHELAERARALDQERAALEQERVRLESLGDQIELDLRIQAHAAQRSQLLARLQRAGELVEQNGTVVVRLPGAFTTGSTALRPEARERISVVSGTVSGLRKLNIFVEGHTDDTGGEQANLELSRRRAEAVRDRLVALGIPATSLRADGFGETRPIESNGTSAGRERNRRIELIISAAEIAMPDQAGMARVSSSTPRSNQ